MVVLLERSNNPPFGDQHNITPRTTEALAPSLNVGGTGSRRTSRESGNTTCDVECRQCLITTTNGEGHTTVAGELALSYVIRRFLVVTGAVRVEIIALGPTDAQIACVRNETNM
jgi:hypothetical protein